MRESHWFEYYPQIDTDKIARALFTRTYHTLDEYIQNEIERLEDEKFGLQETDNDWSKKTVEEQQFRKKKWNRSNTPLNHISFTLSKKTLSMI